MAKSKTGKQPAPRPREATQPAARLESNVIPTSHAIPLDLQQRMLDVFRRAFTDALGGSLQPILQQVKKHLFDRDFLAAFGKDEYLEAYAARWSSGRALGYAQVFHDISPHIASAWETVQEDNARKDARADLVGSGPSAGPPAVYQSLPGISSTHRKPSDDRPPDYDGSPPAYEGPPSYPGGPAPSVGPVPAADSPENDPDRLHVVCLGGGAGGEVVALAGWLRSLKRDQPDDSSSSEGGFSELEKLSVCCIDIAQWTAQIEKLSHQIVTPPNLSKYASAQAQAANVSLLPAEALAVHFEQQDVLNADVDRMRLVFQQANIITIMFTLNELYTTSVSKTQRLLFELTVSVQPGTLLLVVDSPGSYSSVTINGAEKQYPMQWLLDHTLLEASKNTRILVRGRHWEKLVTDESRWFRLPKDLKYPIELENMRYQIHLYRRCKPSGP